MRVNHDSETVPTVSVDYGFFGMPGAEASGATHGNKLPVLIVRDRLTKMTWAHPVPSKGLDHPHGARKLLEDLQELGYKKLVLKSDQEPAIRALCREVKYGFAGEVIPEEAPRESHERSNGEAEVAVQMIHGLSRTLKEHVAIHAKVELPTRHPILAWMVEYSAVLICLFGRGAPADGMTPYPRHRGRPWRIALRTSARALNIVEGRTQIRRPMEAWTLPGNRTPHVGNILGDEEEV
jgi:hypothetical protein